MCVCVLYQVVEEDEVATAAGGGRGMRDLDLGDLTNEDAVARLMRDLEGTVKEME